MCAHVTKGPAHFPLARSPGLFVFLHDFSGTGLRMADWNWSYAICRMRAKHVQVHRSIQLVLPRQEKLMEKQDRADDSSVFPSACYLLAARTVLLNVPLELMQVLEHSLKHLHRLAGTLLY